MPIVDYVDLNHVNTNGYKQVLVTVKNLAFAKGMSATLRKSLDFDSSLTYE